MSESSLTTVQANHTLDNTSPVFSWFPYGEGLKLGPTDGWVLWSSGLGYNTSPGQSPAGDMLHVTNRLNASVSLTYFGTSLYLFGSTNCSYSVTFDNASQPSPTPSQGMLFTKTDVPLGMHTVNLTALPSNTSQMLLFDHATFTTEANSSTSNPTVVTTNNQDTSGFTYQPASQWSSRTVANIPDADDPQPFHYTNVPGSSATFDFYGRSVALFASMNFGHGEYSVNLDGAEQVLNGSSFWLIPNPVIYFADGLNESQLHHLNITNLGEGQTLVLTLFAAQVTQYSTSLALAQANQTQSQSSSSESSSGTNVGAIVGGVVGGVVFLLVVLFVFLFFRRKRRQDDPDSGSEKSSFLHTIFPTLRKEENNGVSPFLSARSPQSPSSQSTIYWNAPFSHFGENSANGVNGKTGALAPLPSGNSDRKTPIVSTNTPIPVIMRKEPPPVVPRLSHPYSGETTTGDSGNSHGGSVVRLEDSVASPSSTENAGSGSSLNAGTVLSDPHLVRRVLDLVTQRIDRPRDDSGTMGTHSSDGLSHLAAFGGGELPSYERSASSSGGTT